MSDAIQREIDFSLNAFEYLKENEQYLSKEAIVKLDKKNLMCGLVELYGITTSVIFLKSFYRPKN